MAATVQITFDASDPAALARFWAEALDAWIVPEERMAALEDRCAQLVALGARRVRRYQPDGLDAGHIVMQARRATSSASTEAAARTRRASPGVSTYRRGQPVTGTTALHLEERWPTPSSTTTCGTSSTSS